MDNLSLNQIIMFTFTVIGATACSGIIHVIYDWCKQYYKRKTTNYSITKEEEEAIELNLRKPHEMWNKILLFPDELFPDIRFNSRLNVFPELPESPTYQFLEYFKEAQTSIAICAQLTSFAPLEKIIFDKHREGLIIQIVTDYDSTEAHNNYMIVQLHRRGLTQQIRAKNFGYLMHNKFAIIDEEAVISGSMNWTKQAFRGNHENILISTNQTLVKQYQKEFSKLWLESEEFVQI